MNPRFLRECIIEPTLKELARIDKNYYTENSILLLMETCAVESNLGTYIGQLEQGVALGFWQVEPATYDDLFVNFIKFRPKLMTLVDNFYPESSKKAFGYQLLQYNHQLNCLMARLVYWRAPFQIPSSRKERAIYWKDYYNTYEGRGTVKKYIEKSEKYLDGI